MLNDLKKNALSKCHQYVEGAKAAFDFSYRISQSYKDYPIDLVACTKHRTMTVYFACQKQNKALNECLGQYTTDEQRDKLRESFLIKKRAWRESMRRAAEAET